MNAPTRRSAAALSTDAVLNIIEEESSPIRIVPNPQPGTRHARARVGGAAPTGAGPRLSPARVDLVEQFDTGQRFLRAYIDGHFYWQPVSATTDEIRDRGVWMTGRDFHEAYWVNYGAYRRRDGSYHPVDRAATASRGASAQ
jgi:hypothetical protein